MTSGQPSRGRGVLRRHAALTVALAAGLVLGPMTAATSTPPADDITPVPIKATPAPVNETAPAADGTWFLWARGHANVDPYHYLAQRGDTPRVRIDAPGTTASRLGGGISGRTVVYLQISDDRRRSGLFRFDLGTGRRTKLPPVVNSRHREYDPSISGRYIVFQRAKRSGPDRVSRIVLYDRVRHTLRGLATERWSTGDEVVPSVFIGQVNGDHVVWTRQRYRMANRWVGTLLGSSVFHYDISTRKLVRVLRPDGYNDSDPAVSADGTVYLTRGANGCGGGTGQILRLPVDGPPEVVLTTPVGQYATDLFVDDRVGHRHHVYYAHHQNYPDDISEEDVYKLVLPAPTPVR